MSHRILLALASIAWAGAALPQVQPAAAPAAQPISKGLGVIVYPAKGQASSKQAADEHECYNWAQGQTGITPGPPPAAAQPTQQAARNTAGSGAVKGAVAGVAIGAVAGDAGKGAAIGATTGLLAGGRQQRKAQEQNQANAQQAQQAQSQQMSAYNQQIGTFKKAFGACLQGRGYTVN